MSEPFIGEIRMFGGNFAPAGWALCQGATLQIAQNDTLFTLLGTTYGGDGQQTFRLPDLSGRVPVHQGNGHVIGETGGAEEVTLTVSQIPAHTHPAAAATQGGVASTSPSGNYWSRDPGGQVAAYRNASSGSMNAGAIGLTGGSQPHNNMMPFVAITFFISLFGIFPQQS
jgi:microcystin-dependent protein